MIIFYIVRFLYFCYNADFLHTIDSFNVTTLTLTLLAERFLNSFYDIQDYRSPTRMPTDSGDNGSSDSNNDEFPTI